MVIGLGAEFDQLDEIGSGLGAPEILANASEWIFQDNLSQRMEVRFPAARDLDFGLEKQIQFARERAFGPARASSCGLDTA
jgi:hypothetical protein